jgi:NitT/TauT family transport system substrate-binding protein
MTRWRETLRQAPFLRALGIVLTAWSCSAFVAVQGCHRESPQDAKVVTIGYFANLTHAQAVLGVASGEFEKAVSPAKLDTKVFNAGPSLIEALFAGAIDIGYVGPGPALSAFTKSGGKGIRVVAGAAADGVVVVARKGSGIQSFADLKGRKVGTPQLANTQDISARHYLTAVLKQTNLDNVVPVDNAEQASMFSRGELDAAWAPEPWGQRLISETGATLVGEEKDLWPSGELLITLVVTTPEFLAAHGDVVDSVLRVHRTWTQRLAAEPDRYAGPLGDALFGLTGKRLAPGILPAALKHVRFTDDPGAATLQTFALWRHDLAFDPAVADLNGLVDDASRKRVAASTP